MSRARKRKRRKRTKLKKSSGDEVAAHGPSSAKMEPLLWQEATKVEYNCERAVNSWCSRRSGRRHGERMLLPLKSVD
ncbi:hypothetical protein K0M31_002063 [Melipona bicolor]|uniref:Uncharacterized protein n=1 Tax=Melipona bicolor TaxID=60889 RepID=A0AA40GHI2_9HYME|nr:hypothetical protein K0M31_002063 [Melipona bicolor]